MYQVEATELGISFHISGHIREPEAKSMFEEVVSELAHLPEGFKVFADMRGFKPASSEVGAYLIRLQQACMSHGVSRSVVVLDSALGAMQMRSLATESGVDKVEKYLTPDENPNWGMQVRDWLLDGVDPDLAKSVS